MLLSISAGRSNRSCASFVRLARHRAHRRQDSLILRLQCSRYYGTESAELKENLDAVSESVSSRIGQRNGREESL